MRCLERRSHTVRVQQAAAWLARSLEVAREKGWVPDSFSSPVFIWIRGADSKLHAPVLSTRKRLIINRQSSL